MYSIDERGDPCGMPAGVGKLGDRVHVEVEPGCAVLEKTFNPSNEWFRDSSLSKVVDESFVVNIVEYT